MRSFSKKLLSSLAVGALATGLVACSNNSENGGESKQSSKSSTSSADDQGQWPRTIKHELGETTLEKKPENIANTALSVTGVLLAMDAPVKSSAATSTSPLTDDKGFFTQWAKVADERNVEVLYPGLQFDMEALYKQDPDVVIISTAGADSVRDQYDQISKEFPTIAVDYAGQSWEKLATQLGEDLGLEKNAEKSIKDFDEYAAKAKDSINPPAGGVSIVSYNGPGQEQGVAKQGGTHARLLESLGLEVKTAPADLQESREGSRGDFSFYSFENLTKAITGETVFLLSAEEKRVQSFTSDPVLANLDAVKKNQVYPLGLTSFRIDPYSGRETIDQVVNALRK